jgi:uncharacterized membrane protein YtjA (UPF0391 family)
MGYPAEAANTSSRKGKTADGTRKAEAAFGFAKLATGGPKCSRNCIMLKWALILAVVAIIAGALGFTGIAGAAAGIAKILFFLFLIGFIIFAVLGVTVFKSVTK